jgi:endonuclease/exonuclease/phosphatase family metal-dependent hydrolase
MSPDGYWQFIDGEWRATEKQISALEKGATPHNLAEESKLSSDGFWKLSRGKWIPSEKQTSILGNRTILQNLKQSSLDFKKKFEGLNLTVKKTYSNLHRDQKLQIFTGIGVVSVTLILILIIASISFAANNQVSAIDCSSENRDDRGNTCPLEIASWNLNRFGPTSAENDTIRGEIAEKISNYGIVAVQEIKDNQDMAPYLLQDEISTFSEYGMVLSNRTGSFCENKSSSQISEQYAFYYDISAVKSLDAGQHYPNTDCEFAREPFAGQFRSSKSDYTFVLITLHVKLDDALSEISALENVFEWAKFQYPDEDDFILLGDLNAGCDYVSPSQLDKLDIRNGDYLWIVPDETKTNTAVSRSCAYDRIIVEDGNSEEYLQSFSTDCETEASDHCIISAQFSPVEI